MIRPKRYNFRFISHGVFTGNNLIADNGQMITGEKSYKVGDFVTTIPADKCSVCDADEDLTEYGFVKYGYYWYNKRYLL